MKKTMLLLAAVAMISFTSCKNSTKSSDKVAETAKTEQATPAAKDASSTEYPEITFEEAMFDFGTINEGDVVTHVFKFTNTGDAPLKVLKARPSCGCTVPSWSKDAIAPGESGEMTVKFNSNGKHGHQNKSVSLTTNTKNGREVLRFKANVLAKKK